MEQNAGGYSHGNFPPKKSSDRKHRRNTVNSRLQKSQHFDLCRPSISRQYKEFKSVSSAYLQSSICVFAIEKPFWYDEQIVHHLVIRQFREIALPRMYEYSFGSIPGRGTKNAVELLTRWRNSYHGKKFYVAELDIKKFYHSIDIEVLKAQLQKLIRDKRYLEVVFRILDAAAPGLPLGYYTSPWLANWHLTPLDRHIVHDLRPDHYMRYADNLFLFHRNKKELHKIVAAIEDYLATELHLELNGSKQIYRFEYVDRKTGKTRGRAINALGFIIHHNRATLRKTILKRSRAKANRMHRRGRVTRIDAAAMISYMGWYTHGVWYDMEEIKTTSGDLAGAADAFCSAIEKAGLYAGVYANLNWWTNYLTSPVFEKYDRWCAQYYRECELKKPFGIWQYTDALVIGGKNFDGNFAYKDYPALTAGGQQEESGMSEKEIKALVKKEVAAMTSISGTGGDCSGYAETETEWCKRKGIFGGDGKGNFGWGKAITRQDAACIIYRAFESLGMLDALPDISEE